MPVIRIFQVDAFASRAFEGNPAAVCPLAAWLPDALLQAIAAENALSETAYVVPTTDPAIWSLRWFTPACEVALCGHATLASAAVVLEHLAPGVDAVRFETREAGPLTVRRLPGPSGDLEMSLPAHPPSPAEPPPGLLAALGLPARHVEAVLLDRDYVVVVPDEATVRALNPNMLALREVDAWAVAVTAPGDSCDFVSRFFAPARGVPEDPVTGSAHCHLVPYWAERLGRRELIARQVSSRGGELRCAFEGSAARSRVLLAGRVTPYLEGTITVPADV